MKKFIQWNLLPGLLLITPIYATASNLVEVILSFCGLLVLPILLHAVDFTDRYGKHSALFRLILASQPIFAVCLGLSFIWEAYSLAFSLMWFVFTLMLALHGIVRILQRGIFPLEELTIDIGFIYTAIGGFWLLIYHSDVTFLGFTGLITLLTANHFHYVSLSVPIFIGLLGRMTERTRLLDITTLLVIVSPIFIAIGITYSPALEFVSSTVFAATVLIYACLLSVKVIPVTKNLIGKISFAISALATLLSMLSAIVYAAGEFTGNTWLTIPEMITIHGITNAFFFTLGSAIGWLTIKPKANYQNGIPFSKLQGKGRIGADFFERNQMVAPIEKKGLVDSMADFQTGTFEPDALPDSIRDFYEETSKYELLVYPHWKFGFKTGARIFKHLSKKIEQMNFPLANERREEKMESYVVALDDIHDGRTNVRAWVRIFTETRLPIYVAAYSTHTYQNETYMNIAFPLPFSNMTSILRLYQEDNSLILTSLSGAQKGDAGVYLVNPILSVKLLINETIQVWSSEDTAAPRQINDPNVSVIATHDMWLFGLKFLTLHYYIYKVQPQSNA